jgi:hypothetical protein
MAATISAGTVSMAMHSKYSRSACQARSSRPVPPNTASGMMETIKTRTNRSFKDAA